MSYNFQLTKKEAEIASWAIEAMELNLVDIDSDEVGYKASDIPLVGRGMMFIGSPFALNDLLYRVEDQYIDMAKEARRNEGENTAQDIRYAKSLASKIKKAIEVMSRPFPHLPGLSRASAYVSLYNVYCFHQYVDKFSIIEVVAIDKDTAIESIIHQMDKGKLPSLRIFDCLHMDDPIPPHRALVALS